MRWKKRIPKQKKERCVGQTKIHHRFAVFPILIGKEWVWWELYKSIDVWLEDDPNRIISRCSWHFSRKETIDYV